MGDQRLSPAAQRAAAAGRRGGRPLRPAARAGFRGCAVRRQFGAVCRRANLAWLLAARGLQGTGAALLLPSSLAILGNSFSGEARGRAVGTWSAASAIGGAIGPVLGGWLIDVFGWRAIFLLNIPLAIAAAGLALVYIRDPVRGEQTPIDLAGALLAAVSLGLLTWGLTVGAGRGGWSMEAIAALVAGIGLFAVFLWVEWRRGDKAMMPLALFRSPDFVGLSILTLLLYGALGGLFVLVPYVLIQGAGFSATAAGAALLPLPLILAGLSRAMGGLAGRIGSRLPLTFGPIIVAAGILLLSAVRFRIRLLAWRASRHPCYRARHGRRRRAAHHRRPRLGGCASHRRRLGSQQRARAAGRPDRHGADRGRDRRERRGALCRLSCRRHRLRCRWIGRRHCRFSSGARSQVAACRAPPDLRREHWPAPDFCATSIGKRIMCAVATAANAGSISSISATSSAPIAGDLRHDPAAIARRDWATVRLCVPALPERERPSRRRAHARAPRKRPRARDASGRCMTRFTTEPPFGEDDVARSRPRSRPRHGALRARSRQRGGARARSRADLRRGRRNGVTGTPTIFIDGVRYDGAWDFYSHARGARAARSASASNARPGPSRAFRPRAVLSFSWPPALRLICANTAACAALSLFIDTPLGIGPPGSSLSLTVADWFSEGLLAVFFLLVGLEIRRELTAGALTDRARRRLPVIARHRRRRSRRPPIYLAINRGAAATGWSVPTATDIAFALGMLALLGNRVPAERCASSSPPSRWSTTSCRC